MSKTFNNKSSVIIFLILFIIKMCLCEEDKCITSTSPKYEEYFMEHEVTQKEAKIVFDQVKDELLNCKYIFLIKKINYFTFFFSENICFAKIIKRGMIFKW